MGDNSPTSEQRIVGHRLVQGRSVLRDRRCPLAPQLCETEEVSFQSKHALMETLMRDILITTGLTRNRWLRLADETTPQE
jgi:hypothetical protein